MMNQPLMLRACDSSKNHRSRSHIQRDPSHRYRSAWQPPPSVSQLMDAVRVHQCRPPRRSRLVLELLRPGSCVDQIWGSV